MINQKVLTSLLLALFFLNSQAFANESGERLLEVQLGGLWIGLPKSEISKAIQDYDDLVVKRSSNFWRFDKPYKGLQEIKFVDSRISELVGEWIFLNDFPWGYIKKGDSYEYLLAQGLKGERLIFHNGSNFIVRLQYKSKQCPVKLDSRRQFLEWEARNFAVELHFRGGLVDHIVLYDSDNKNISYP